MSKPAAIPIGFFISFPNNSDFKYDMVRTGIGLYGYGNDKIFSKYLKPGFSSYEKRDSNHFTLSFANFG